MLWETALDLTWEHFKLPQLYYRYVLIHNPNLLTIKIFTNDILSGLYAMK